MIELSLIHCMTTAAATRMSESKHSQATQGIFYARCPFLSQPSLFLGLKTSSEYACLSYAEARLV